MRTSKPTLRTFGKAVLSGLLALAWLLPSASTSHANGTPKPPPPPPPPATPTDTPEPTDTSEPPATPKPSATSETGNPPLETATSQPTNTAIPVQQPPNSGQTEKPVTSPDCQSSVQGTVRDSSGKVAAGATVFIEGEGWSDGILTDDSGRYGFAGLCAGTATLSAYLANGQASQAARVTLNGRDPVEVDLSPALIQATVAATAAAVQRTATPEPDLPATGYSGWLLAGAALFGLVLLLSAGVRRVLGQRTQDHN